jgi:hypothetical protein
MKTVKVTLEIELVAGYFETHDEDEKLWFENEVMVADGNLVLHSNDIGDTVGVVKEISDLQYFDGMKSIKMTKGNLIEFFEYVSTPKNEWFFRQGYWYKEGYKTRKTQELFEYYMVCKERGLNGC